MEAASRSSAARSDSDDFEGLMQFIKGKEDDNLILKQYVKKVKEAKALLFMVDSHGMTALHLAIVRESSPEVFGVLLQHKDVARHRLPLNGRLPLHVALEHNTKEEVLDKLIEAYEEAIKIKDEDQRLPLHMILEHQPFPSSFVDLSMKVLDKYPEANKVKSYDRLPLHICLDNGLPPRLVLYVLKMHRWAAMVPKKDGKLPLHMAVEMNMEIRIVTELLNAYPAALLKKIPCPGESMIPLEYAIVNRRSQPMIECLMKGGTPAIAPKAMACARAAAVGRITKDYRHQPPPQVREQDASAPPGTAMFQVRVQPAAGEFIDLSISAEDKVEDLKSRIQEVEGTVVQDQRLSHEGNLLADGLALAQCGILEGSVIVLQERYRLLQQALKHDLDEGLTLQLLALRPTTASEEDQYGVLPLHTAIKHNAGEGVLKQLLLQHRKAVKVDVGTLGEYPLNLALRRCYSLSVIEELLKGTKDVDWHASGAYDPNHKVSGNPQTMLPLHTAITFGSPKETISMLLRRRCPIGARDKTTGLSALECVLVSGRCDELFELILRETRANSENAVHEAGPNGQQPLHVAAIHGAPVGVFERLCELSPLALESYSVDGRLPIHLAVSRGAAAIIIRVMINHKPRLVHARDSRGLTPIQLAIMNNPSPGVVFELVRADTSVLNVRDQFGRSPLELAAAADAPIWVIQELLRYVTPESTHVNLLSGKWPNTKASAMIMQVLQEMKRRPPKQLADSREPLRQSQMQVHVSGDAGPVPEAETGDASQEPAAEDTFLGSVTNSITSWFW